MIKSQPALCCGLLLAFLAAVRWLVRDSLRVDGSERKHVVITGCDSGFGNLLARQLDRKGFHVVTACLTEKGAADLSAATSARLKSLVLDVTDSSSIERAVQFVSGEVGERGERGVWGAGASVGSGGLDGQSWPGVEVGEEGYQSEEGTGTDKGILELHVMTSSSSYTDAFDSQQE